MIPDNEFDSVIEQARIDVHHSAEQVAAVNYLLEQKREELERLTKERNAIHAQFSEKCEKLARLRDT